MDDSTGLLIAVCPCGRILKDVDTQFLNDPHRTFFCEGGSCEEKYGTYEDKLKRVEATAPLYLPLEHLTTSNGQATT
jgi:hypothetical protein